MKKILIIVGLLFPIALNGQEITGKVTNSNNELLIGANVYWAGTTSGTQTDQNGKYTISTNTKSGGKLVAAYVGHKPDTLKVRNQSHITFKLKQSQMLDEVLVERERDGVIISDYTAIRTEKITQTELKKAACCDLAGCFETQTTVQPQTTNIITNSKELRILGLSGIYNQVLIDGFPMIQGLSYTYGISSIPGTLVDNIYVAQGANSVKQGYESISGQINVETLDPDKSDKLLLNAYINSFAEKQFNANYTFGKGKWSNLTAFHTVQPADKIDKDKDTFLDVPLLSRYMLFNKWQYGNSKDWGLSSMIGLRYVNEQRIGGQISFTDNDKGSSEVYGQSVRINQPEFWSKTGYRLNNQQNIVLFVSGYYHEQDSYFGTVSYDAKQANLYGNLQYEHRYKAHELITGISFRYLTLDETIAFTDNALQRTYNGDYNKLEYIPGAFAENTMHFFDDKLTWIAGIRGDIHNEFGLMATPRTLLKYNILPKTTVRASIGTGRHSVNLFSENIGLLVSSRDIIFSEKLQPEQALNYGINLTQKFESAADELSGYFSANFYRTDFQNQIFPDYDTDPTKAIIKNFRGTSISNGFQAELNLKFWERIEFKTGYNYLDVYRVYEGSKDPLPFNSKHKLMSVLSYKPLSKKFHIDINGHWFGKQHLPDTKSNPEEFRRSDFSEPYTIVNAQFTLRLKDFEVYAGCENLFDYRQEKPIISWQNPFGPYFDTSSVWGPTRGREFYLGLRFRLEKD